MLGKTTQFPQNSDAGYISLDYSRPHATKGEHGLQTAREWPIDIIIKAYIKI